jgi:hypothetical protein
VSRRLRNPSAWRMRRPFCAALADRNDARAHPPGFVTRAPDLNVEPTFRINPTLVILTHASFGAENRARFEARCASETP